MTELWIVLISAVIPLSTLIYSVVGLKHKAEVDYFARLEHRLEECERDRERLWKVVRELQGRRRKGRQMESGEPS